MSKHTVPPDALIVVADGAKAILLRNTGTGSELALKEEKRITPKSLSAESGQGPSGSRPGDQTIHQTEEATFAKQLADALYAMRHKGDFKQVVLIADPQTLGQMRECLHKEVEASMVFTLSKDYTNQSVADIQKALS
ncbi:host attachment family protein [Lichenibacterium ramalinae]|uniref:Host attachment protein n=1 Tax=Lichenibacterium ramalinae TaxID=2316527 RepID=A0A4Q2RHY8_9HYPH|nr:host attachment family protein [Lichenibacterium ramalinae]RYB07302.1 host attachment protein [Lichenibacterium ramalinae]